MDSASGNVRACAVTPSEEFVFRLSQSAFLPLWTYANPLRPGEGKELCDVLIVCPPHIIIFSVKECEIGRDGDPRTQRERWLRSAVDTSVRQVYGAERQLRQMNSVATSDGSGTSVDLGPDDARKVHRVAVAIGSGGSVPLESRDYGKGFVHVFGASDVFLILNELDTITDFVEYLIEREAFFATFSGRLAGTEQDLIAIYLSHDRSLSALLTSEVDLCVVSGSWASLVENESYLAKKSADEDSYVWDRLIALLHDDFRAGTLERGGSLEEVDAITRIMAREGRFARRLVGRSFRTFMDNAESKARQFTSISGTAYVFLKMDRSEDREYRVKELHLRCLVVRDKMACPAPVIGLATERYERKPGFSVDAMLLNIEEWGAEQHDWVTQMNADLGFFSKPLITRLREDEYPSSSGE